MEGGEDRKISREGEKEGDHGGNISPRISIKQISGDDFIEGWPKWLVDNIPRDVLAVLSDLTRIISRPEGRLPEPQVKSYMLQQLLSGLQHCHRDVKASNLLIDKDRMLQIADFGLANFYRPKPKWPLASRVVTLWYRAPELLLGSTDYGVGIGMSSRGDVCRKANHAWQK
ncbi:probable serine/threonine-protein kinase At1g54610 [Coffea arabica]|uniref:Probable serine/threonine-protein kinase At1g54610 n=1 Tax=Coffea arabica TaxID=13443 RepID=A0ABM4W578_COFAR